MEKLNLEEVFQISGVPNHTFVEPTNYNNIKVALRTKGRCVVLEGPSGIGKTTCVKRISAELEQGTPILFLSARNPDDVEMIKELPSMGAVGTVVIDDFHRLDSDIKSGLSDFMKLLADESNETSKLILIGINKAGVQLVKFATDLGSRIDVFRMETNPEEKVQQLVTLGEEKLNVTIPAKIEIAQIAQGSFQIAQTLCHSLCLESGILETQDTSKNVEQSVNVAVERVLLDSARVFNEPCIKFARGTKIRKEGRAPYLHLLKWLSEGDEWSLDIDEALRRNSAQKQSVSQVVDKGYLSGLLDDNPDLQEYFHFDSTTHILSVEDPKLIFFLKNLIWRQFTRSVGFDTDFFPSRYDFALSFAGEDREIAKAVFDALSEREVQVFYDENEQHRILAENIEDYLAPIYRSEAIFVIAILSKHYPKKVWTKFESSQFADRFGTNSVITVRLSDTDLDMFSEANKYGSMAFNLETNFDKEIERIVSTLCSKLKDTRVEGSMAEPEHSPAA